MFSETKPSQLNFGIWPIAQALKDRLIVVINGRCPKRRSQTDKFLNVLKETKRNIVEGNLLYAAPSRTAADAWHLRARAINPFR